MSITQEAEGTEHSEEVGLKQRVPQLSPSQNYFLIVILIPAIFRASAFSQIMVKQRNDYNGPRAVLPHSRF